MSRNRFIIVAHQWFVDSKGFVVIESDAQNRIDAQLESDSLFRKMNSTFNKAEVHLLEIKENESVVCKRKLSLKERISGYITI